MGYTQYWRVKKNIDKKAYAEAMSDIKTIVKVACGQTPMAETLGISVIEGITEIDFIKGISIHGECESFCIPEDPLESYDENSHSPGFDCCKTRGYEYDTLVVACLARLGEVKGFLPSSDAEGEVGLRKGIELGSTILGRKLTGWDRFLKEGDENFD